MLCGSLDGREVWWRLDTFCVYMYMCIYICICVYLHMYICMYTYIYMYTYICVYICIYTYVYVYIYGWVSLLSTWNYHYGVRLKVFLKNGEKIKGERWFVLIFIDCYVTLSFDLTYHYNPGSLIQEPVLLVTMLFCILFNKEDEWGFFK